MNALLNYAKNITKSLIIFAVAFGFTVMPFGPGLTAQTAEAAPSSGEAQINNAGTTYNTIQDAVDAASSGETVNVGSGTFQEKVVVDKDITIQGAGMDDTTVDGQDSGSPNAVFTLESTGVTIKDLHITNSNEGIGVEKDQDGSGLTVEDVRISDVDFGLYAHVDGSTSPEPFDDVNFTDVEFIDNYQKGIYVEKLSNATFENIHIDGIDGISPNPSNGVDINLKAGNYEDITIQNSVIEGVPEGPMPELSAAITVKGRDDGPDYGSRPGSLDGFTLNNVTVKDSYQGFKLGETASSVITAPTNVTITNSTFANNDIYHFEDVTDDPKDAADIAVNNNFPDGGAYVESDATIWSHIQDVIDEDAQNSDTVVVLPGTYDEAIDVDKSLTIEGPNAGTPGHDGARSGEAIIDAPSGTTNLVKIQPSATDVTIDGFTLQGADRRGIFVGGYSNAPERTTIQNNIIQDIGDSSVSDETHGILVEQGANESLVKGNLIQNIDDGNSENAVGLSMVSQNTDGLDEVTVEENHIKDIKADTKAKGIEMSGKVTNAIIKNNIIDNIGDDTEKPRGLAMIEQDIDDETVGPTSFEIFGNTFDNINSDMSGGSAVEGPATVFIGGYSDLGAEHSMYYNNFMDGIVRNMASTELFAEENYWDDSSGPSHEGPGSGTVVSDNVDFSPWLCDEYQGEDNPVTTTDGNCETDVPEEPTSCPFVEGDDEGEYDHVITFGDDRIRSDNGNGNAKTDKKPLGLSAGEYTVAMFGYDDHRNDGYDRSNQAQPHEQFFTRFIGTGNTTVADSPATDDLPDDSNLGTTTKITSVTLGQDNKHIRAFHDAYNFDQNEGTGSANSLNVGCVGIDEKESPDPEPEATLRVCKVLTNHNGEIISGDEADADFSVDIEGKNNNFSDTVNFSTGLDYNTNLFGDDDMNDAVCEDVPVAAGDYRYYEEDINSEENFNSPEYHDVYSGNADSLDDLAPYSGELWDDDETNDDERNEISDGDIVNLNEGDTRTLVIANQLSGEVAGTSTETRLKGFKYNDEDGNGEFNREQEDGLGGWTIRMYNNDWVQIATSTTNHGNSNPNSEGLFTFDTPEDGKYYVCEVQESGYTQTGPSSTGSVNGDVNVVANQSGNNDEAGLCYEVNDTRDETSNNNKYPGLHFGNQEIPETLSCNPDFLYHFKTGDANATSAELFSVSSAGSQSSIGTYDDKYFPVLAADENDEFYGIRKADNKLAVLEDNGSVEEKTDVSGLEKPVAMNFAPDGTLYVMDEELGELYTIDRSTGTTSEVYTPATDKPNVQGGDLAINEYNELVYVNLSGDVYFLDLNEANKEWDELNVQNGAQNGNLPGDYTSLSYNPSNGEFSALDIDNNEIDRFTIDKDQYNVMFAEYQGNDSTDVQYGDGTSCLPEEESRNEATLVAQKLVCEAEEDLPNWGNGADIDGDTAQTYAEEHDGCELEPEWEFEWAPGTVDHGESAEWNSFYGSENINIDEINSISIREVLPEGYIPFTFLSEDQQNTDDVTAEFYCSTDGMNYDNLEWASNLSNGDTVNCVGFNTLEEQETGIISGKKENSTGQGIAGWQISLYEYWGSSDGPSNDPIATTTTSQGEGFGWYQFSDVSYGTYLVCEDNESEWSQISPQGGGGTGDCDNGTTGHVVTIGPDTPYSDGNDFMNEEDTESSPGGGNNVTVADDDGGVAGVQDTDGDGETDGEVKGVQTESCDPYLNNYLHPDAENDRLEVLKLQIFLSGWMGIGDVTLTGTYDRATEQAVRAFQSRYADDVLGPWGISEPTGYVYKTTKSKINSLLCNEVPFGPFTNLQPDSDVTDQE